ncbi:gluconolactonase [Asaia bogorensis NBRC 16594]|uniref:Gluconolactonase n=2 Tax=Asaia bogorensis TaxID=91915 RepID=A0AAN4R0I3_9PROT|nr:SMP-30/gluconolactonase/LRE family protein [Asaia bogorensis]BAT20092.1 gluconolactonase [Asaia bogorensis NBRC 16594]GBQ80455.1 gluconolactonase [Asaia bogorensis NBRC 16594]GEL52488.1 gluconolactonase [Asaia bogorensis NBRC 16594]
MLPATPPAPKVVAREKVLSGANDPGPAGSVPSPTRRRLIRIGSAALGAALMAPLMRRKASAHDVPADTALSPPSVVSTPPRLWGPEAPVAFTPDPDIISYDPSFSAVILDNAPLVQAWKGKVLWLEGPAWSNEGRFLITSDVMGSTQYRYLPEERCMTVFRKESYHSNGNTFDREGRLITCEHGLRRVIRWEHDGRCTVLAESFNGKRLNSPNDIVVDHEGGIWFTDPPYGDRLWEGHPDAPDGATPTKDNLTWNLDLEATEQIGGEHAQATHVFHLDPETHHLTALLDGDALAGPNGLCFSPDQKTLYIVSSEKGALSPKGGGYRNIYAFDVQKPGGTQPGTNGVPALTNQRVFADMTLGGHKLMPDGIKADRLGNLWVAANGPLGLCGVFVYNPAGKMIGRLRLPRSVSNLCFGGTQRDRLFMCAENTIFTLDVATQGAGLS